MVHFSPKKIALLNALIITLVVTVVLALVSLFIFEFRLAPFLIFPVIVFSSSYYIFRYSLEKFIYEKIKIIYKTIGRKDVLQKRESLQEKPVNDILDIVNQVVMEWSQEKEDEIKELKRMAQYRREFLGNVSHELKTPIFNIQGYLLTLLDGGLHDENINVKFLKRSVKSVNRMIAIVEDLEDIAKLESGELKLQEESFDLVQLSREVMDFLEMKATKYNSAVFLKAPTVCRVLADKKRIRQVLINLIDNGIKYGDAEKGEVHISIYDFHDHFLVEVSDNGIGIPEESLYRVFERFFRTDEGRSRKKGGSGLGLAIVKHILEAHRQTISVRSKPDEGTTFSFTLSKG